MPLYIATYNDAAAAAAAVTRVFEVGLGEAPFDWIEAVGELVLLAYPAFGEPPFPSAEDWGSPLATILTECGGTVVQRIDGASVNIIAGAGARRAELERYFEAATQTAEEVAPPWMADTLDHRRLRGALCCVGDTLLLSWPLDAGELGAIRDYFSVFADVELSIGADESACLRGLASARGCPECASPKLDYIRADASMPEAQIACTRCGGMFDISAVAILAPYQKLGESKLRCPVADGRIVYAVTDGGEVLKHDGAWSLLWNEHAPLFRISARGERLLVCGAGGTLRRSSDGGKRWFSPPHPLRGDLFSLASSPEGTLYVGGKGIIVSDDDGQSWRSILTADRLFVGLSAPAPNVIYACERDGALWRTTNGGKKWRRAEMPRPTILTRVIARAEKLAVAVGDDGAIFRTVNGRRWKAVASPTTANIEDLVLGADQRFYALALDGTILHSADGEVWRTHPSESTKPMWGLTRLPSGEILCLGEHGTAIRVTLK